MSRKPGRPCPCGRLHNRSGRPRAEESIDKALIGRSCAAVLPPVSDPLERESWRRIAAERASALTTGSTSAYPYHTLLKVELTRCAIALVEAERAETEANVKALGDAIAHVEDVLRRACRNFRTILFFWRRG